MPEFAQVLALALLPALGNFAGGLLAESLNVSRLRLNQALHAAAGVVLADMIAEAHEATTDNRTSVAALVAGFGPFMLVASYLH